MKYQKLSLVTILRPADGSDCTMNGISTKYTDAVLLVPEGMEGSHGPIDILGKPIEIDESTLPENTFILIRRTLYGQAYFHVEPFAAHKAKKWCMFGGNLLDYSGNGFHTICGYPIRIHDRIEP